MQYLILLIIFAAVFFLTLQIFPRGTEKLIRERLAPQAGREKKKSPGVRLLGVLAPINKLLKLKALREKIKTSLTSAGSSLTVNEFLALKELCIIFLPAIYVIFVGLPEVQPVWVVGLAGLGFVLPELRLKQRINARHSAIAKALPNVIDLLNLTVGAGLDFMVAVKKMVERSEPNPLVEELHQVWQETKVGVTRQEALRNMARRIDMPEVSSFVRTLVQADRMGTGIEEALRMQSEEALTMRFQKGEREALKAPIKMLFPLLVFILPVVLIIVGGPIILQFLQGGFGLR